MLYVTTGDRSSKVIRRQAQHLDSHMEALSSLGILLSFETAGGRQWRAA